MTKTTKLQKKIDNASAHDCRADEGYCRICEEIAYIQKVADSLRNRKVKPLKPAPVDDRQWVDDQKAQDEAIALQIDSAINNHYE